MGKRKKISKRLNDVAATLTQISARLAALESRKRRSHRKPPVEDSNRQHIADSPPDPTPPFSTEFADEETVNLRRFLSNPGAAEDDFSDENITDRGRTLGFRSISATSTTNRLDQTRTRQCRYKYLPAPP
jgi:hypothetical protein